MNATKIVQNKKANLSTQELYLQMKNLIKTASLLVMAVSITACSSISSDVSRSQIFSTDGACKGLLAKDPQYCKGEQWQQIPNFEHEAIYLYDAGFRW